MKGLLLGPAQWTRLQRLGCLLLLAWCTVPVWAQAAKNKTELAGTVLLAIGEVKAIRNGTAVVLIKGSAVQPGDAVTTGNSATHSSV